MRWIRWAALVGFAWCVVVLVQSVSPGGPYLSTPVVLVSMLPVIAVFGITVVRLVIEFGSDLRDRRQLWRTISAVPPWAIAASAVAFAGFWLVGATSIVGMPGQPERGDGGYSINNHGVVSEISRDEYLTLTGREHRIFIGVAGGFTVISAVAVTALLARRRGSNGTGSSVQRIAGC
jgi:hypothetical protein